MTVNKVKYYLKAGLFSCLRYYSWPIICLATMFFILNSLFGFSGFLFLALRCTAVIVKTHNLLPALQMFLATVEQQQQSFFLQKTLKHQYRCFKKPVNQKQSRCFQKQKNYNNKDVSSNKRTTTTQKFQETVQ